MKVLNRDNLQLLLSTCAVLLFLGFQNAHAADIHCKTAFGEKSFTISDSSVAFHSKAQGRKISSILEARTKVSYLGFRKVLYVNGNKHLIHIENKRHFNDSDDYMSVVNQKGHKMTYPLTCSK
jgi:hypothetical protein